MITEEAYSEAYTKHFYKVYRVLFKRKSHKTPRHLVLDLTQDAWVRAWERRDQWRSDCQFHTWVTMIAVNILYSYYRRKQFKPLKDKHYQISDKLVNIDRATVNSITVAQLLGSLHSKDANVLDAYYLHGLGYKAIGQALGVTKDYARLLVHRARQRVKQIAA